MDECGRSRVKPLGHLPLCCPYEVVELLLQPPLVSVGTVASFQVGPQGLYVRTLFLTSSLCFKELRV